MKNQRTLLLFLTLVLVCALLFSSVPAWAGGNPAHGKSVAEARKALEQELLPLAEAGFVGIAHSEAEDEVMVFVEDEQAKQRVPFSFEGYTVRTEVTGLIETLSTQVAKTRTGTIEDRQDEVRPLVGGTSLSAYVTEGELIYLYAGTLGMVTYDNKVLSNAHVIATNPETGEFLDTGTPIVQPGTHEGGSIVNQVGELEAYIPIDFGGTKNYADAAIGSIDTGIGASAGEQFSEEDNYWLEGWTEVSKGDIVRKSGRTTGVTTGEIVQTNASVWIRYGDQSAYFVDQIVVVQDSWSFAAPGDSGSAVDKDGEFVGLVFAGSATHAVVNKAAYIIEGLDTAVELPEGLCSLTISSTQGGEVYTPGEGRHIYDAGTVVELVAEADEYYEFDKWTGDKTTIGNFTSPSTTITMDGNYKINANFKLKDGYCSLTVSSTYGGSVTQPDERISIHAVNATVDLVAEADEDYRFVEWTGDVSTIADVYAASTNITMEGNYSVTANFELKEGLCSLTISSTYGGEVNTPPEQISTHAANTTVNLVAVPYESCQFAQWTGDVITIDDVYAAETTITMYDSYSITAKFESLDPTPFVQLAISSTRGGSVTTPGEGIFLSSLGDEVNLVAEPSGGSNFTHWSGDVETIADVEAAWTTIIMDNSYSIRANFEGGGWCFIATAAYGSPMAEEIEILRQFRDEYLLTNPLGRALVDLYYRISPPIADLITEHPSLKPIVRAGLLPAVTVCGAAVNTTPAVKMAMAGLLVLISVAVAGWASKRRTKVHSTPEGEIVH
jgi:uncharacterized repeat protein (TIGR02543 family)